MVKQEWRLQGNKMKLESRMKLQQLKVMIVKTTATFLKCKAKF